MDFDDLLTKTVRALPEHPDVLAHYQRAVPAHPVDEYQDTNRRRTRSFCARRASTASSRRRRHDQCSTASAAPTCATSPSSRRRSPTSPRSCSIRTTAARRPSSTRPTRSSPTTPAARTSTCGASSAPAIGSSATTPRTKATRPRGSVSHDAASCTSERHLHVEGDGRLLPHQRAEPCLEEALMRFGIPYKVVGGTRFYDRREIKDAMAYLRAVVNPADEVSVKRVLNVPKRGVGDSQRGQARRAGGQPTGITLRRGAAPRRRRRRHRLRGAGRRSVRRAARRTSREHVLDDAPGDLLAGRARRAAATWPSWRPSTRSRPPAGSRTSASWSARPASSRGSTSSSSRSRWSPTPTSSTATTTGSC